MEEVKSPELVSIDKNFIVDSINELMQHPAVQRLIYLQKVLKQVNTAPKEEPTEVAQTE